MRWGFKGRHREEDYEWVHQMLRQIRYRDLKRSGRGLVRCNIAKTTRLSRAQNNAATGKCIYAGKR